MLHSVFINYRTLACPDHGGPLHNSYKHLRVDGNICQIEPGKELQTGGFLILMHCLKTCSVVVEYTLQSKKIALMCLKNHGRHSGIDFSC